MACDIATLQAAACENGYRGLSDRKLKEVLLVLLCNASGEGSLQNSFEGVGSPVGVITPAVTAAIYFDTSDGTQWNWYSGSWH